ncbi:urate hydroxylase PuuD [Sphingomonas sp.]|uniref:urate hydroxylase PuuD n=1 Tax=Sphingomonas sp. TaxID=28214 RepID=UPI00286DFF90|nr:urate hydroxylase PuuD [Sphingomonas sp.]
MGKLLENLNITLGIGLALALALMAGVHAEIISAEAVLRWLHVFFGVVWIGLLYYFNFVQIPTMPAIPAELKPAVSKHIAPNALFYFRWGAAFTVLTGALLAWVKNYLVEALTLQDGFELIGIGMWLALIMAFNVWFIIWPNQQRALGLVEADDASKAKSARTAMLASRTNTALSIPMLYAMATYQTLGS